MPFSTICLIDKLIASSQLKSFKNSESVITPSLLSKAESDMSIFLKIFTISIL